MGEGPRERPLVLAGLSAIRGDLFRLFYCGCVCLGGGNGELAVLDVNAEPLSCVETYVVCQPAA